MTYEELLKTIPQNSLVVAIQCNHDTDVDEVCSCGASPEPSNIQYCYDYIVEKFEYLPVIKTLHKYTYPPNTYHVDNWSKGGYVVYIRDKDTVPKTLYLKGLNYKE